MTARRDLTPEEIDTLRTWSAERITKAEAARRMGVDPKWFDKAISRTSLEMQAEWKQMFPTNIRTLNAFTLTEQQQNKVRNLVAHGMNTTLIAEQMGINRAQFADAVKRAGITHELAELRKIARANQKVYGKTLPRDVDPAVKWLTREWRAA